MSPPPQFVPPSSVPAGPAAAAAANDDDLSVEMEETVPDKPPAFAEVIDACDGAAEPVGRSVKSKRRCASKQDDTELNLDEDERVEVETVHSEQPANTHF